MRHLEIKDLWLQKEVYDGNLLVKKILGEENPSDLMTKILGVREVKSRVQSMSIERKSTVKADEV
eukprot:10495742-Karenia_brevis.AAC.1